MADPDQIEAELRQYFTVEANLSRQDRLVHLRAIFNKHFGMDQTTHLVNNKDLYDIISLAKTILQTTSLPLKVTRETVRPEEVAHIMIIEAFVGYLNKNKLLKRLVKFDFTK